MLLEHRVEWVPTELNLVSQFVSGASEGPGNVEVGLAAQLLAPFLKPAHGHGCGDYCGNPERHVPQYGD
jgi:hypothetical protein